MTWHACLACGHRGPEVQMTIVEIPPGEQRPVDVPIVVATDRLGRPLGMEYHQVPERFAHEPRCPDYNARPGQPSRCRERIAAQSVEAAPTPSADVAEEGPSWLRQP
jgi:hypothetical protein